MGVISFIYVYKDVQGQVTYLQSRGERVRKGKESKFQKKAHRTFDPRNALSPVVWQLSAPFYGNSPSMAINCQKINIFPENQAEIFKLLV